VAELCRQHGIDLCYLFGSQVSGYTDAFSDVDFGVVFPPGLDQWEQERRLLALGKELRRLFEPLEVDLVPLADAPCQMQFCALQESRLLYCANDLRRADFEEQVQREWHDFEPFITAFHRDLVEGIQERRRHAQREPFAEPA